MYSSYLSFIDIYEKSFYSAYWSWKHNLQVNMNLIPHAKRLANHNKAHLHIEGTVAKSSNAQR